MKMPVKTPKTSATLVKLLLDAGYIEHVENFPVAHETKDAYWFVAHDNNTDEWMVSAFFIRSQEFLCDPAMVDSDYETCVRFLHCFIAEMVIQ